MWWPTVNCVLLACIATAIATNSTTTTDRSKRDLQFWKDLITAKLGISQAKPVQNDEPVQVINIPGFEKVVVKAVPKVTVVEAPPPIQQHIQMDPTMTVLQSYLGTQTPEQTLLALQHVKDILQSGLLKAREEVVQVMPPQPQIVMLPPMAQSPRPLYEVYERPLITPSVVAPPPEFRPYPVFQPVPVLPPPPELRPIPVFQPSPVFPAPVLRRRPFLPPVPTLPPRPPALIPPPIPISVLPPLTPQPIPVKPPCPIVPDVVVPQLKPLPMPFKPPPLPFKPLVSVPIPPILPLPTIPTSYSYKQVKGDGIVTYSAKDNHAVVIQETNVPLPPPPSYIMDRFQKIIYGLPLGVSTMSHVSPIPLYPGPIPVISRPSNVEVRVSHPNKVYEGIKMTKNPFKSGVVHEEKEDNPLLVDLPLIVPPSPVDLETSKLEEEDNPHYKRVHGDGSFSTFTSTSTGKEHSSLTVTDEISKMPSHPSYVTDKEAAGKAHKPKSMWGYSFKIASGVGSYENSNKDKIYYSHLTSGAPKPGMQVFPDPLSSQDDRQDKSPNKNVYYLDGEEKGTKDDNVDKDEFGNPFLSKKIKGENVNTSTTTGQSNIEAVKKFPPLPTPILGENEDTNTPKEPIVISTSPLSGIDLIKKSEDNKEGSVSTFSGNSKVIVQETVSPVPKIPGLPSAVIDVIQPLPKVPSGVAIKVSEKRPPGVVIFKEPEHPRYVYKQISHANPKPITVVEVEDRPMIAVPKGEVQVTVNRHYHTRPDGTRYPCSELHRDADVNVIETVTPIKKIPVLPSAVVDVIQPLPKAPAGMVVKVNEKRPPAVVMVAEPGHSRYVYKQISHTNPKPLTVVEVEDRPMIAIPKGEVQVKVNRHFHTRPDGTRYPCSEVHRDAGVNVIETVTPIKKIPVSPSAVVDVIQPKAPASVVVKVNEKRPSGVVMVTEPEHSRYVYKQISHTNPKPLTVVEVEDRPVLANPKGEVQVKVNRHYHSRPDGTRYPCSEVHIDPAIPAAVAPAIGIPIAPIPPHPSAEVVTTMPSNFIYIPPKTAYAPSPISHEDSGSKFGTSGFSYTQINKKGSVSTFTDGAKVKVVETVSPIKKLPVSPSAIVDVIKPIPKAPSGVVVKVSENRPHGVVTIAEPVPSRHVYKQINTNLKPFAVIEDRPVIEVPKGEVQVKVNRHYHTRSDGTRYPCSEVHLGPGIPAVVPAINIPIVPVPPRPTAEVVSTVPSGLIYVQSESTNAPESTMAKLEVKPHYSYTQVSHDIKIDSTTSDASGPPTAEKELTTTEEVLTTTEEEPTTTEESESLSRNPIVVADSNYSYTNTHVDGSSVNVQGNKDNTVTINVEQVKGSASRGDIPDALA